MDEIRFEWDDAKNLSNQRKHGLSFEKASTVFFDPLCVTVQDRVENGELRWRTTGNVGDLIIVTVAHTVSEETADGTRVDIFRIISARRATRKEKRRYEDENG